MSDYSVFKVQVAKKGIKCFRSLVQPRAFDSSAASVMELRAILAVHIFYCVLVISNVHVGLLFWA